MGQAVGKRNAAGPTIRSGQALVGLFAGSDGGAETGAILGSLLTTAKLKGLDPYTWLNDVLERIVSGEIKSTSLWRCLPWHWKQEHADMNMAVAA